MAESSDEIVRRLEGMARELRSEVINMLGRIEIPQLGKALSAVEIITTLYFHHLRINSLDPLWDGRDRFLLCKRNAAPILLAALAKVGLFPLEKLQDLNWVDSILQGNIDMSDVPGADMIQGSISKGLSVGLGSALEAKNQKKDFRVFVLLGREEVEAEEFRKEGIDAVRFKANNLTAIVDYNRVQIEGSVSELADSVLIGPEPMVERWESLGWFVIEIDGHNISQIVYVLDEAARVKAKPTVIVAHTIDDKG